MSVEIRPYQPNDLAELKRITVEAFEGLALDQRIEEKSGRTVPQIFAESGEDAFRRYEQQLTAELASAERIVLAPGGGWPMFDENVATISPNTAFIWLQVSAEEAVQRLRGGPERPLLAGSDPLERARAW